MRVSNLLRLLGVPHDRRRSVATVSLTTWRILSPWLSRPIARAASHQHGQLGRRCFLRKARIYVSISKILSQIGLIYSFCVANCASKFQHGCIRLVASQNRFRSRMTEIVLNICSYLLRENIVYITHSNTQGKGAGNDILCHKGRGRAQNCWLIV